DLRAGAQTFPACRAPPTSTPPVPAVPTGTAPAPPAAPTGTSPAPAVPTRTSPAPAVPTGAAPPPPPTVPTGTSPAAAWAADQPDVMDVSGDLLAGLRQPVQRHRRGCADHHRSPQHRCGGDRSDFQVWHYNRPFVLNPVNRITAR